MSIRWAAILMTFSVTMGPALAFDSFEHSEIGDRAFQQAIEMLEGNAPGTSGNLLSQAHLSDGEEPIAAVTKNGEEVTRFTFGDLVAIYGDHVLTFEGVNSRPLGKLTDDGGQIQIENIKKIVRGHGRIEELIVESGKKTKRFRVEQENMLELVVNNPTHFSLRAAQEYVKWHKKALELARQKNQLWKALHYEALALHSFTDLFAFGHMHDNRERTDKQFRWAREGNFGFDLLAKLKGGYAEGSGRIMGTLVNFDHNGYNWRGAQLMSLAGETWKGHGDGRYRIAVAGGSCRTEPLSQLRGCTEDPKTAAQRKIIVRAAAISILEVLNVASGKPPAGVGKRFPAMCHLPVHYINAYQPVDLSAQLPKIAVLAVKMWDQDRPIWENGFDFELGDFEMRKKRDGAVGYIDFIQTNCGMTWRASSNGRGAKLVYGAPGTDNTRFSATCRKGGRLVTAGIAYNGSGRAGRDVKVRFVSDGRSGRLTGRTGGSVASERGLGGVEVKVGRGHGMWRPLKKAQWIVYQVDGERKMVMGLRGSSRAVTKFLAACKNL